MVRPLTPSEIRAAFGLWGVPFRESSGWETRSNSSNWTIDGSRTKVTGVMYHHTGDDASDSTTQALLVKGRSDLPGPLCNFMAADDGKIVCIAAGSANHAGKGDPDTLALLAKDAMPLDREVKPDQHSSSAGSVGGNSRIYGWESAYGGGSDLTPNTLQHRATLLSMAAIIHALDKIDTSTWSGGSMLGHREWTDWKPDPRAVVLYDARKTINALLKAGPSSGPGYYKDGTIAGATTTGGSTLSSTEVTELKEYFRDLVWDGFTINGAPHQGIGKVGEQNAAAIAALTEKVAGLSAAADPQAFAEALAPLLPDTVSADDLRDAFRQLLTDPQPGATP